MWYHVCPDGTFFRPFSRTRNVTLHRQRSSFSYIPTGLVAILQRETSETVFFERATLATCKSVPSGISTGVTHPTTCRYYIATLPDSPGVRHLFKVGDLSSRAGGGGGGGRDSPVCLTCSSKEEEEEEEEGGKKVTDGSTQPTTSVRKSVEAQSGVLSRVVGWDL